MTTKSELHEITSCEVCGNGTLLPALNLGLHPLCDDLVEANDPRRCEEYPIEIMVCERCVTAHQHYQVPKRTLFPETYHYRSRFTADVLSGMEDLVGSVEARLGSLAGKTVLDIGCNDGSLLDFARARGAKTIGVEPTGAAADAKAKGHAIFQSFLEADVAEEIVAQFGHPDVITFTNVFAHIENLTDVIGSLKILVGPKTMLAIENHYLVAVLDKNQFDTFYHEHPRTYSCTSFVYIAKSLGLDLTDVEFPSRYGGNIRVYLSRGVAPDKAAMIGDVLQYERQVVTKLRLLQQSMSVWREAKKLELKGLVERFGPLRGKAFPGRAAILIKLLGLDESAVSAVYEKPGSMKIGHYVPGTRILIRSDDELFEQPPSSAPLLNFAWHISPEIRAYLTGNGYKGPVIDIVSDADFNPPNAN